MVSFHLPIPQSSVSHVTRPRITDEDIEVKEAGQLGEARIACENRAGVCIHVV